MFHFYILSYFILFLFYSFFLILFFIYLFTLIFFHNVFHLNPSSGTQLLRRLWRGLLWLRRGEGDSSRVRRRLCRGLLVVLRGGRFSSSVSRGFMGGRPGFFFRKVFLLGSWSQSSKMRSSLNALIKTGDPQSSPTWRSSFLRRGLTRFSTSARRLGPSPLARMR